MADTDLTQEKADALLGMAKLRTERTAQPFPQPGERREFQLSSRDGREDFILGISRSGRIDVAKMTYQIRYRTVVTLARLDIGGSLHRNPDRESVPCPHIHLYREGYAEKWAWPAADRLGELPDDSIQIYPKFCEFCAIIEPPTLQLSFVLGAYDRSIDVD